MITGKAAQNHEGLNYSYDIQFSYVYSCRDLGNNRVRIRSRSMHTEKSPYYRCLNPT